MATLRSTALRVLIFVSIGACSRDSGSVDAAGSAADEGTRAPSGPDGSGGTGQPTPVSATTGGGQTAPTPGAGGAMATGSGGNAGAGAPGSAGSEVPLVTGAGLGPYQCPAPPYAESPFDGDVEAVRVQGVPATDAATDEGTDLIIIEGPVWLNETLYLSEMNNGPPIGGGLGNPRGADVDAGPREPPPARILALHSSGEVTVMFDDVGTNGLGADLDGNLVGCSHKTGSVQRFGSMGEAPVDLVSEYLGNRFASPNDLTFGADGTLYFTDPDYQAPEPVPQEATRAYRVAPGTTTAIPIIEDRPQPNGVTLSPDRKTLYVAGSDGIFTYAVEADGSVGEGTPFAPDVVRVADGMAVDCAGNLYAASGQTLFVVSPVGSELFRIAVPEVQSLTNVAFGGADHKTVYVTALGTGTRSGLFQLPGQIPGMPY